MKVMNLTIVFLELYIHRPHQIKEIFVSDNSKFQDGGKTNELLKSRLAFQVQMNARK